MTTHLSDAQRRLVEDHLLIAEREAVYAMRHGSPATRDELKSAAYAGLIDAAAAAPPGIGYFGAFATRVIRRVILREVYLLRRQCKGGVRIQFGDAIEAEDKCLSPLDVAAEREDRCRLQSAIAKLPAPEQKAITMRLDGRSAAEIARKLRLHPRSVNKAISRATGRLHAELRSPE